MSTSRESQALPPSLEVQREMALAQINSFRTANREYRQLVDIIYKHPSAKLIDRLTNASGTMSDSSDPLVETMFFKDIDPDLVQTSVTVLIEEINQNRRLSSRLEDDEDPEEGYDDEFRQKVVERILSDQPGIELESDEPGGVIVIEDPCEMAPDMLAKFMGRLHGMSVHDVLISLQESESVNLKLEREYEQRERMRTIFLGVVAFAGALGGTLAADRLRRRK